MRFTHYEVRCEPDRVRAALTSRTIAMLRKLTRF
jgi:hypothetical protein